MNLLDPIESDRVADAGDYFQALTDYETPLGQYLAAKFGDGWWHSLPGQFMAAASLPDNALAGIGGAPLRTVMHLIPVAARQPGASVAMPSTPLPQDLVMERLNALPAGQRQQVLPQVEQVLKQAGYRFYTEAEWRASPDYRDMPFEPFMTPARAKAKAAIYDTNRVRDWLIAHRPDGVLSGTLGFLAGMAGGAADPTNLLGWGAGGKLVLGLARTGGLTLAKAGGIGALSGALPAVVQGYAIKQPLARWGETLSDSEIWRNAGLAAALGSVVGAGAHGVRILRSPQEPVGGKVSLQTQSMPSGVTPGNPLANASGLGPNTVVPTQSPAGMSGVTSQQLSVASVPAKSGARVTGALGNTPIEQLLDQMSLADKHKLFGVAIQDFIDNGYKYRADQVHFGMANYAKGITSPKLVLKETTPISIGKDGRRSFASTDKHVADRANEIERDNPGHVVCTNCELIDPHTGDKVGEIDILTRNAVIQVKAGTGGKLTHQVLRYEKLTGFPTIGYGPDLGPSIIRGIGNAGGLVTKDEKLLREVIKP